MALDLTASPPETPPSSSPVTPRRNLGRLGDRGFHGLVLACGLFVLVVLALVAYSTTKQAWSGFTDDGVKFFTSSNWNPATGHFGAAAFAYGSVVISVIALVFAVPVSIGIALFVTEVAPNRLRRPIVYVVDLLAAIPSVVYGLWGIVVFAPTAVHVYNDLAHWTKPIPLLGILLSGHPVVGRSLMTAGVILAIMVTPIITAITREVFATTPVALKEGAMALGATRWEMIRGAVFPHSRSGLVSAVLIGFGRAVGETIAVALVIGNSAQITARLFSSGDSMASVIALQFGEAEGTHRSSLIALGVTLLAITLIVGVVARIVLNRAERRLGGVA